MPRTPWSPRCTCGCGSGSTTSWTAAGTTRGSKPTRASSSAKGTGTDSFRVAGLVRPGLRRRGPWRRAHDARARAHHAPLGQADVPAVDACAHHALALAAVGRGDFDEAYEQATAASASGARPPHTPLTASVALDLVEAAIRTGRHAEAAARVEALREAERGGPSVRAALIAGAAAGLCASPSAATAHFERALGTPGSGRFQFDTARVRLLYGERLRRARATSEARAQLRAAHETFVRLRARPWIARAESELRAAGSPLPGAADAGAARLTPQEREIALLAATGLTNKEIGRRLFLSHRTVGAHLYRIFPKLGITSRAALRDALNSATP